MLVFLPDALLEWPEFPDYWQAVFLVLWIGQKERVSPSGLLVL